MANEKGLEFATGEMELSREKHESVLPEAERWQLLYGWNQTEKEYPREKCIHELFEQQVVRTPEAAAVVFEEETLSYSELNRRANRLAHYLRELGVKPDTRVAICIERSVEMVVGLLAVLKAGGAYVPLDPAYPVERLRYMLEDSAPTVLLTQAKLSPLFQGQSLPMVNLSAEGSTWQRQPESNPDRVSVELRPEHLAYVIYTSGSTGMPKGVMIEHRGLCNMVIALIAGFGVEPESRFLQFASFSFDACVCEVLITVCSGASLYIPSQQILLACADLIGTVSRYGITHAILPPAVLAAMPEQADLGSVSTLITAGESLPSLLAQRWMQDRRLINAYGPTEATVCATMHDCVVEESKNPPIGRPIANTRIYILDRDQAPVPIGVTGELYIGGAGVARGYLNRPELTAERFVADPFVPDVEARMYKTGDLARWLPDGTIEYLGRNDDQVKIRGFRIELGEIEARLAEHAKVREAVVIAQEQAGEKRLVAYYTSEEEVGAEELRGHLAEKVPEYMVPAAYVWLEKLPLTPNGKLDRKALPSPEADAYARREYEAPQGEVESTLAGIWAAVLKVERIGRHDNFFALGGHSLLAVKLIEQMRQKGLHADVRALFSRPTLAESAASIGGGVVVEVPANRIAEECDCITPEMLPLVKLTQEEIERIVGGVEGGVENVQDIYPLAPLQEGILFHHLMASEGDTYLLSFLYGFDTRSRLESYLGAMQAVIDRHDILRTAVIWEGLPEPVQLVWRRAELLVEEIELDAAEGDVAEQLYTRFDPRHYRINLRRAPMLRFFITYDSIQNRWLLLMLAHHLAIDHATVDMIVEEIPAHLEGRTGELPKPLPFRNFVAQARLGVSREEHEEFFRGMLGDVEEPTAPFGLLDVQGDGSGVEEARQEVDAGLARRLRERARKLGVSVASVCHLAWAQVLARVSGREDVVFGTVLFGRMQGGEGADRALGLFINTLPVRIRVGEESVEASVRQTQGLLAELLRHEHAPLALAQRCSGVLAPTPLFSALLNYVYNVGADPSQIAGVEQLRVEERTNYPLIISVEDRGEGLLLIAQMQAWIAAKRICELMHTALERLAEALETEPGTAARKIDVLPAEERRLVVEEWNERETEYPGEKCIHALFEEQVERTPEATAVVCGEEKLTYCELNGQANRLGHELRELGVRPGDCVGTVLERSINLVIAELAIVKCGAAYVPLDPSFPRERKQYLLADCGAKVVLTIDGTEVPSMAGVVRVNVDYAVPSGIETEKNLEVRIGSKAAAYVMYTSGSTGEPKGVVVPHRAVSRLVLNNGYADFGKEDRVAFASNPAFDATTMEVWAPLLNGGCIVVIGREVLLDPERFGKALKRRGVTVLWLTVGLFNRYAEVLCEQLASLRYLIVGGDALDPRVIARMLGNKRPQHLLNGYGPTETTTFAATHEITVVPEHARSIPIGRPIANTRIYILDRNQAPVPIGVTGELYIGGAGVALGYLNRPELTAERFVVDPFVPDVEARMYKTGDLARWLPDGTIEFVGRNDDQVKIRGFRIELGEIEARLAEHAKVREAVVIAQEQAGEKRLVAYYTSEEEVGAEELRGHLAEKVPEYMVPAAYVWLERMPLTPNGKLDRKALPSPEGDAYARREYEAPQGEVESTLAGIWAAVLKVERVGRHDNFFALGGHSLLAVKLIEQMRQKGLHADVRALFSRPTLAESAASIGGGVVVEVPVNRIPEECNCITPEMLPLVKLTQEEIERIVGGVEGGVENVQDIYPLAPLQEGILFHHLMASEGDTYLLSRLYSFDTRARLDRYLGAMQAVVDRHDTLRTAVIWEGLSESVQVVWRNAKLPVEEVELDAIAGDMAEQLYARFDPRSYRIDLVRAPMLRIFIAYDSIQNRWLLLMLNHHLAIDHTTVDMIEEEIQAHLEGRAGELPKPLPFRNFVAQARLGVSREEHEEFFREMLGDVEEPTAPFGLLDVQGDGSGVEEARLEVDGALARRLRARARKLGVSVASMCHLAWAQVLARVSGREDVVFGTVLFGRMQGGEGADRALGLFINTLPVRIRIGDEGVEASVRRTQQLLADLLRHEHAPLALAQRCSAVPAPAPLFSAVLNYRHSASALHALTAEANEGIAQLRVEERTNYPLILSVEDLGYELELTAQVRTPTEAKRVCELMHTALERLVEALESEPRTAIKGIDVLPERERGLVVEEWNATEVEYEERDGCIHELFEEQVARTPEATAVVFEDATISYGELNRKANQLAHYLRELGVKADTRVAICAERSVEMVVGLLAVLKAGGAYVPLDPAYPVERLRYMLADSAPAVLLTQKKLSILFQSKGQSLPMVDLSAEGSAWHSQPESNLDRASVGLRPEHLAYVIYTSGSTGMPKGVMIEHRGVVNRLLWMQQAYGLDRHDAVLQKTPFSFDVSVWEFFWPLLVGAKLVMARPEGHKDPAYLVEAIRRYNITTLHFVPSMLQVFLEHGEASECSSLKHVVCSGEALPAVLARRFQEQLPKPELHNLYGPTEASVDVTAWTCMADASQAIVPIGRPIANTRIYILGNDQQPTPIGVTGELYIAGVQVARGYLNRPELTAERFVADPFVPDVEARMYKTGDLARWLPDGTIEYLGRNDDQVKIRGFRIELGEIEARLVEHAKVREAVVIACGEQGEKRLVAYYTSEEEVGAEELRGHLAEKVPEYMVPAAYVWLEKLPLTPNGKLDRKALPSPEADAYARREYEAPQGEIESALAGIWAAVLKVERIGRHDNFFALGGHSLLAVKLIEQMRQKGLHADVRALFSRPTLAESAASIGGGVVVEVPANRIAEECDCITPEMLPLVKLTQEEIERIVGGVEGGVENVQDIYPLAPLQEGILFHHLMGGTGDPYLQAVLWSFDTRARLDRYLGAMQAVVRRHDVLRTAVIWEGLSESVQVVWRNAELLVEEVELNAAEGDVVEQLYARFDPRSYRIDLRRAPMLRLFITYDPIQNRWLLLMLVHHLVGDLTTKAVIDEEIQAHLEGKAGELPKPLPFRNFVAQARLGVSREEHEEFFREMLGDVEEPTAPFGLLDAQGDGSGLDDAQQEVDGALARRLRARARKLGVSVASMCHLAWAQVLARVSGREDVVFGTVLFGRMQGGEGSDRALGLFINTLPVRIRIGEEGAEASVRRTQGLLAGLLRHEHASLALAQRCSAVPAPTPLFSALLNYRYNADAASFADATQLLEGVEGVRGEAHTNYLLTLSIDDMGERFQLTAEAQKPIEARRVCELMHTALKRLVEALESEPRTAIKGIDVLPERERGLVVEEWNATEVEYTERDGCIHELFEEQVARTPEATAVVFEDATISYGELNRKANQLAHYLRELGVKADTRVAICAERSVEMVVGLLAVLKAGGAYVPLDPAYPVERLRYMLVDSAPAVLLTQKKLSALFQSKDQSQSLPMVDLSAAGSAWHSQPESNLDRASVGLRPEHLAYVIYTSGSTGMPKGVMIEHRGVVNRLLWMQQAYGLDRHDAVLQKTPFSFDVSVWEFFWPLLVGAKLVMARPEGHKDPAYLVEAIRRYNITTLHFVPSMLQVFLEHGEASECLSLKHVVCSGEALPAVLARRFQKQLPKSKLHNLYGPTEASVDVTAWTCMADASQAIVPIGRPIANTRIYIIANDQQPTPIGVTGELYIAGVQVARGYLNRPELTAERFVKDPFVSNSEARMYKTGDLARWLPDGTIEYLGRNDDQVKIRGFRIELGEIEARLMEHAKVREAVVIAQEQAGEKRLVAYYTSEEEVGAEVLRAHLAEKVPEYMVPAAYVWLEKLPLTPNGKLDRKALPSPEADAYASGEYEAPQGEIESALAEIWAAVLKVERVGRHDNFFELGGHSLLASQVVIRIQHEMKTNITIRDLFSFPVLHSFAEQIVNQQLAQFDIEDLALLANSMRAQ